MSRHPEERDVESTAARWLARVDRGLTEEEARAFAAWRDESDLNKEVFRRFERSWNRADAAGEAERAAAIRAGVSRRARVRRRFLAGSLAAVLLLVAGLVRPWSPSGIEPAPSRTVAILGPERTVLPDGSIAEFAPGTIVEIAFEPASRRVVLSHGVAHFDVRSDPERPFVVVAEGLEVRAVGTAFSVSARDGGATVVVTHGRVAVGAAARDLAGPLERFVDAGQGVAVRRSGDGADREYVALKEREVVRELEWREQRVEFSGALLTDVLALVNSKNSDQLVLADPVLGQMRLSGVFRLNDSADLARMLERAFEVSIERRDDGVFLVSPRR